MNKFILIGNVTKDPEIKRMPSGQMMIQFSVADNAKNATKQDVVTFYRCVYWGENRFIVDYIKKSSLVVVTGTLQPPKLYTAKDGSTKMGLDVTVHTVEFGPGRKKDEDTPTGSPFRAAKDEDMFTAVPKPYGMGTRAYGQQDDEEAPF